jgi:hypothetical protein
MMKKTAIMGKEVAEDEARNMTSELAIEWGNAVASDYKFSCDREEIEDSGVGGSVVNLRRHHGRIGTETNVVTRLLLQE